MPPLPARNAPSADSVSDANAPRLRLVGPMEGKPSRVGVIVPKYSIIVLTEGCSKS